MKTSINRILTTQVGSLPRPADLRELMRARQNAQPYDQRGWPRAYAAPSPR